MSGTRYFNFPVALLQDFMDNSQKCLNDIMYYSVYAHSQKMDFGNDLTKFEHSLEYYGIPVTDIPKTYAKAEELYFSVSDNTPMAGLNLDIYWSYFFNDKSDFEKASLLGFLAIKSILGQKAYYKLDNRLWLSRMDGNAKSCGIDFLSDTIRKYSSEYMTKKIKNELKDNWGLKSYSRYTRGFYVSFELTLDQLIKVAENNRKLVKEKQKRREEKELIEKVLQEIKAAR